eukprot:383172-Pelagomonas_calceolata.AAC.8
MHNLAKNGSFCQPKCIFAVWIIDNLSQVYGDKVREVNCPWIMPSHSLNNKADLLRLCAAGVAYLRDILCHPKYDSISHLILHLEAFKALLPQPLTHSKLTEPRFVGPFHPNAAKEPAWEYGPST